MRNSAFTTFTNKLTTTQFSLDELYKIWFCNPNKPMQHPLGHKLNEIRLSIHRNQFPNDTISLISNFEDFSAEHKMQLNSLCKKYNIKLISIKEIRDEIFNAYSLPDRELQLELLKIAGHEITHEDGSLAAASDIIRVLSPAIKLGFYTDFDIIKPISDVKVLSSNLDLRLNAHFTYEESRGFSLGNLNNNVFVSKENEYLKHYRKCIYRFYSHEGSKDNIEKIFIENKISNEEREKANNYINNHITSDLPYILKLRIAMKYVFADAMHKYYEFLKSIVMYTTGPECMRVAIELFLDPDAPEGFNSICAEYYKHYNKIYPISYDKVWGTLYLNLNIGHPFINEDDASWLPNESSVEQKYLEYQTKADHATIIQSYVRQNKAKLILSTYEWARANNLHIVSNNTMNNIAIKSITNGEQSQSMWKEEIQNMQRMRHE